MGARKGTNGNDLINGTADWDFVFSGLGNDTVNGLGGDDRLYGAQGNDTLNGGDGDDRLFGGLGADRLSGGDGDDTLYSSSGFLSDNQDSDPDVLDGGAGNDLIKILDGDTASGGDGFDTLSFNPFTSLPGDLRLDFSRIDSASAVSFAAAGTMFADARVSQFERVDFDITSGQAGASVVGSKGGDYISLDLTDNVTGAKGISLSGGLGDDQLFGSWKNDKIRGDSGNDLIVAGAGADTVTGGTGADMFAIYSYHIDPAAPDTITDFNAAQDFISLIANDVVTDAKGRTFHLDFGDEASLLRKGVGPQVSNTASGVAQFLYETDTGKLSLDANGSAAGGVFQLCILSNKAAITAGNLIVDYDYWA